MTSEKNLSIGCVIMAAGNSIRFGENKLLALYEGKSLIRHALDAIPAGEFSRICVVTQYEKVRSLAHSYGFLVVENHHPDEGISHTVRLGTGALMESCDAILYMVSDQPRLKKNSISSLIALYRQHPDKIVCASAGGKRGNPCIFPKQFFGSLLALTGDTGGSTVIRAHEDALLLLNLDPEELTDIDTKG